MQPLPDFLRQGLDVVFCGINPALSAAQSGHHFSHRSNRFWRTLYLAEFTPHQIEPEQDHTILRYGCGLTSAVERPTVQAAEVRSSEFRQGAEALRQKLELYRPRVIAFLGKPAHSAIARQSVVPWGLQEQMFGGALVWVLPNPSGLNRSFDQQELSQAYGAMREAIASHQ
jgi:double-stranded uracil-DNA glycosylase